MAKKYELRDMHLAAPNDLLSKLPSGQVEPFVPKLIGEFAGRLNVYDLL